MNESNVVTNESNETKKVVPVPLIVTIVILALLAAAVGGYFGFCRWVQTNGKLLPGVTAVDDKGGLVADLSGMDQADAAAQMAQTMEQRLQAQSLTVSYGNGRHVTLSGELLACSPESVAAGGMAAKEAQPFWKLGALWLGIIKEPTALPLSASTYSEEGAAEAKELADKISKEVYVAPVEFSYQLDEENVTVVKGTDGQEAVTDGLVGDVLDALTGGKTQLSVETRPIPCQEITAEALNDLIYVEPQAPTKDEDGKMVPAVIGISIDTEAAQEALDAVGPGESCTIPLVHTSPEIQNGGPGSNENPYAEGIYYNDLLATVTTNLDGVATRSHNVGVAAKSCNGKIIAPGATFSYLKTIGSPSVANGYQQSTGYQGGLTVEMVGGGICQVSSSLYYCAVYSNLEIVRRSAHAFATGYIPNGLDATVYYPTLDFQFRNNTGYPIKIVSYTSGGARGTLTVRLYGTNPDGHYVKTERYTTSTTKWTTVYKPDPSIPRGTTKVDVTPYTGYEVDVYRVLYSRSGAVISRTYENHSKYNKRDKVILYNPADSGPWGSGTTQPPVTEPPVTEPPVTAPPVTEPPVTEPPVTEPPVTDPPVTQEPAPTPEQTPEPAPDPLPEQMDGVEGVNWE